MADLENPDQPQESQPVQEHAGEAQPTVEAAPQQEEAAPEYIPYRRRDGTEVPLPASHAQALAEALGYDNAAALVNQLGNGEEAQQIFREAREYYRRATRQQPKTDAEYQGIEQQRQQYQYPQQRPQYQPQQGAEDDPIQLIRATNQQVNELRELIASQAMAQYQQQQEYMGREQAKLIREADREYQNFASELKKKGFEDWKIPDRDRLLEEAEEMGMFQSELPIADIYRRVHRMNYADDYARAAVSETAARARDPKAKVPVPASRTAAPAPAPKPGSLDGVAPADIIAMLKESARRVG